MQRVTVPNPVVICGVCTGIRTRLVVSGQPTRLRSILRTCLGFSTVPWLITAELLPVRAKSLAGGVVTVSNWMFSFIITVRRSAVGGPELRRFLAVCRSLSIWRSVRVFLRSRDEGKITGTN